VPVLLLTARDGVAERVAGLDAGADDYVPKPVAPEELAARLRALLRRGRRPARVLAFDDVVLDLERRSATRAGRDLALTGREADLLELLLEHPRAVVTRERAIEAVWDGAAEPSVVDQYIGYLRRKLGPPSLIHTVRGVGFTLDRS
jgi:two-component system response regulator MprA